MKTICHITVKHTPYDTRIFHKECKSLSRYYTVTLLAPAMHNSTAEGITINALKPLPDGWIARMRYSLQYLFTLARKQKADLYHLHDPELLPLALLLKRTGNKVIFDVHEDYAATLQEHGYSPALQRIFRFFNRQVAKSCGVILAESSYISRYQGLARNYCVVENFCKPQDFTGFIRPDRSTCNRLVYIGTIHSHRGAQYMLEILYRLQKGGLNISLDLIGNITEPELLRKIEKLPYYPEIKNSVVWHGRLSLEESYTITREAFAGLCLLDYVPNHMESYPTKLFEYMACGLPVVASNIPLYKAVIERRECGITVPYDDAETATEKIAGLFANKEQLQQFGNNGPEAVRRNYNWNMEENILLDFYQKMLN